MADENAIYSGVASTPCRRRVLCTHGSTTIKPVIPWDAISNLHHCTEYIHRSCQKYVLAYSMDQYDKRLGILKWIPSLNRVGFLGGVS